MSDGTGDGGDFGGITDATAGGNFGGYGTSNEGIPGYGDAGDPLADFAWGGFSPTNFGSVLGDELGFSPAPTESIVANSWGEDSADSLGKFGKMFGPFLGQQALAKAGVPGSLFGVISGLAQGKGNQAAGAIANGLTGPIGGVIGLANMFGAGIPTIGQAVANHGGYTGTGGSSSSFGGMGQGQGGGLNDWGSALSGLAGLYSMYRGNKSQENYVNSLSNMFGQNSPYAKQLGESLARRDAAGGRRSQYGPREVELQAALAKASSGVAPSVLQGQQQSYNNNLQLLQNLGALYKSGAFSPLMNMFKDNTPQLELPSYGSNLKLNQNPFDGFNVSNPFGGD